ncbi:DUF4810 domain-containing protein [Aestuariibacter sp. AA17]|uniref:DUF4810 domain-containing protein n=1 Tax=Fluctibacter corallii TaxID=2984329 RepID=A0ABT3A461_9ALTE|nr:DUF4810 domain-containing protein [Aestuariibacter sp. AA17]MCV2883415.1 DUF4810 domain-containing protein [Aestuariibacter sp. AA17]
MLKSTKHLLCAAAAVFVVSGCKVTEPTYYHGNFNSAVYSYFKAEDVSIEEQILQVQEIIQTAEVKSKPVAPGVHAHLGMLFFEAGNAVQGLEHFQMEKTLFPESAQYIDFLLKSLKEV